MTSTSGSVRPQQQFRQESPFDRNQKHERGAIQRATQRAIESTTYENFRLPSDGRKWKSQSRRRRELALYLARWKAIYMSVGRIAADLATEDPDSGWSRATVFRVLKDLRTLGILASFGLTHERGTRVRTLKPSALAVRESETPAPANLRHKGFKYLEDFKSNRESEANTAKTAERVFVAPEVAEKLRQRNISLAEFDAEQEKEEQDRQRVEERQHLNRLAPDIWREKRLNMLDALCHEAYGALLDNNLVQAFVELGVAHWRRCFSDKQHTILENFILTWPAARAAQLRAKPLLHHELWCQSLLDHCPLSWNALVCLKNLTQAILHLALDATKGRIAEPYRAELWEFLGRQPGWNAALREANRVWPAVLAGEAANRGRASRTNKSAPPSASSSREHVRLNRR